MDKKEKKYIIFRDIDYYPAIIGRYYTLAEAELEYDILKEDYKDYEGNLILCQINKETNKNYR